MRRYSPFLFLLFILLAACEDSFQLMENNPVGNKNARVHNFGPENGVLRLDTLIIYGEGFNPLNYQNDVYFPTAVSTSQYVDENGQVTDSVVYRYEFFGPTGSIPAAVADATGNELRVIVPTYAVDGPVLIVYGVDTVRSTGNYNLITTELRPIITSYVPQFGGPGLQIQINVQNSFAEKNRMVVGFGRVNVMPDTILQASGILAKVPNIFPGPTDLRVGKVLEGGDTLWSRPPVNFGILPVPQKVKPVIATFGTGDEQLGTGEFDEGQVNLDIYITGDGKLPAGVTFDAEEEIAYWIDDQGSTGGLIIGDLGANNAVLKINTLFQRFRDLVFVEKESKKFVYIAGKVIRQVEFNPNFTIKASLLSFRDTDANSEVSNIKVVGNNVYWCDQALKKIMKGQLAATGPAIQNAAVLYDASDGLVDPVGIAVNERDGFVYITDQVRSGSKIENIIWRGTLNESTTLITFHQKLVSLGGAKFIDVEADLEDNFLYWAAGEGIYRKPLGSPEAQEQPIYQFPSAKYFELIEQ